MSQDKNLSAKKSGREATEGAKDYSLSIYSRLTSICLLSELYLSLDVYWICFAVFADLSSVFSLLKNEILGAQIEDFKETSDERRAMAPLPEGRNLFSYRPKR